MRLDELREAIAARVAASHSEIVRRAFQRLFDDVQDSSCCSYSAHFQFYRRMKIRLVALFRAAGQCDTDSQNDQIGRLINDAEARLYVLKRERYKKVCRDCSACRTRSKAWPVETEFINGCNTAAHDRIEI